MPLKLNWYLPPFRGSSPKRAGLVSPRRLPCSGQPWALAFTWEYWKNSTDTLACYEDDCPHWWGGLPSCSRQWRPSSGDFLGPWYTVPLPRGRKGHLSLAVPQHFQGTWTEKAPGHETLSHVSRGKGGLLCPFPCLRKLKKGKEERQAHAQQKWKKCRLKKQAEIPILVHHLWEINKCFSSLVI